MPYILCLTSECQVHPPVPSSMIGDFTDKWPCCARCVHLTAVMYSTDYSSRYIWCVGMFVIRLTPGLVFLHNMCACKGGSANIHAVSSN